MLYGQTESYLSSITTFINTTIAEIREEFDRLNQYADGLAQGAQAVVAMDVVLTAIACGNITPQFTAFIIEFFRRAKKSNVGADKLQVAIEYAKTFTTRGDENTQLVYSRLQKAMEDAKKER